MNYVILPQCVANIKRFCRNVARKYAYSYSLEQMHKNVDETIDAMYKIENGLHRRVPTIERWKDCYMANTSKWYFAYKVFGETVVVMDACHAQNMK